MKQDRILSLDAFRGLTIASMILVNTPGSWTYVYAPLRHATWHGWTPTDLIFPFFLFIVGVAMSLSFSKHMAMGMSSKELHLKIIRRSLIIFGLGLFMAAYPFNIPFSPSELTGSFHLSDILRRFENIRIPGVLQRIALCYLVASIVMINLRKRGQIAVTAGLLVVYWMVMKLIPAPGYARGDLSLEGNLARYLDIALLTPQHLYRVNNIPFDPEGLLSTLPAIATTLLGLFVGDVLRLDRSSSQKASIVVFSGLIAIGVGKFLSLGFPINKQIWTPTYSIFTAGWAALILGVVYWIMDVKKKSAWAKPFIVFGSNSIFVFVASGLVVKTIVRIKLQYQESAVSLYTYIYKAFFVPLAGNMNGSLLFAISWILMWLGILWILYRKRIFIKI